MLTLGVWQISQSKHIKKCLIHFRYLNHLIFIIMIYSSTHKPRLDKPSVHQVAWWKLKIYWRSMKVSIVSVYFRLSLLQIGVHVGLFCFGKLRTGLSQLWLASLCFLTWAHRHLQNLQEPTFQEFKLTQKTLTAQVPTSKSFSVSISCLPEVCDNTLNQRDGDLLSSPLIWGVEFSSKLRLGSSWASTYNSTEHNIYCIDIWKYNI